MSAESNRKRRQIDEEDDNDSDPQAIVNDPEFEDFLEQLKDDGNYCLLEDEVNGLPVSIKYEGDSGLEEECQPEQRMRLRSAEKQIIGVPTKATEKVPQRQLRNKSETTKNVKSSTTKWEPDLHAFRQHLQVVDTNCVLMNGDFTIVYERMDAEYNHVNDNCNDRWEDEYNDGSFSDVEYLGSKFDKEENKNIWTIELEDEEDDHEKGEYNVDYFSKMNVGSASDMKDILKFREKVITALKEPYDQEEYDKLSREINLHRVAGDRHMELRNGKEISSAKKGKSYLDHYSDVKEKLREVKDDKSKSLNLLRGFFCWLEQTGPFRPWKDPQCLAILPGLG